MVCLRVPISDTRVTFYKKYKTLVMLFYLIKKFSIKLLAVKHLFKITNSELFYFLKYLGT